MEDQVVEIMQAIQEVTPEVAAQAVAYGRWCNICWMLFALVGGFLAARAARYCQSHWNDAGSDYVGPAICSGVVLAICWLISVCAVGDLIGSYIAPDYFAVDAVLDMVRTGAK